MSLQQGANQILNSVAMGLRLAPQYDKKIENYRVEKEIDKEKQIADYKQAIIDKREARAEAEKQAKLNEVQRRGEQMTEEGNKILEADANFIGPKQPEQLVAEAGIYADIGKNISAFANERMRLNPTEKNIMQAMKSERVALLNAKYEVDMKKWQKEQMKSIMEAEKDGKK